jgi:hypothetical protein
MARRFDGGGRPVGGETRVSPAGSSSHVWPDVAALSDGKVTIVWTAAATATRSSMLSQTYNANGSAAGPVRTLDTVTQPVAPRATIIARMAQTTSTIGFAVAYGASPVTGWSERAQIRVRTLTPTGTPAGAPAVANTKATRLSGAPALVAQAGGAFSVAFAAPDGPSATHGSGVAVRLFGHDGRPLGEQEQMNTVTLRDQAAPALAMTGSGTARGLSFLAAWETAGPPPTNGTDVAARPFAGR